MKNKIWIFIIAGAILIMVIANQLNVQKQQNASIGVLYFKDGVQVYPQQGLFSIVIPPGGTYDAIAFNITVKNTGTTPLDNVAVQFLNAKGGSNSLTLFPGSTLYSNATIATLLQPGQSASIVSGQINTSQFESWGQPVVFNQTVLAGDTYSGAILSASGSVSLTISPSSQWIFQNSPNGSNSGGNYYIKPIGANSSSLIQLILDSSTTNYTIPASCWNYVNLTLYPTISNGYCSACCNGYSGTFYTFNFYCYDGATENSLVSNYQSSNPCNTPSYHPAVWWNIGSSSTTCFLANTSILMADGSYENIQDVKIGQLVMSYDNQTNTNVPEAVIDTFHHNQSQMGDYYLVINGFLKVTPNHPILINGKFEEIGNAKIGDYMQDKNGNRLYINSIQKVSNQVPTFNLEINNIHTYYADNILVHNKVSP